MRGLSELNGSWNTICACRRSGSRVLAPRVSAVQHDAARGRLDQPQQRLAHGGLAAARFAHQRQRAPGLDRQRSRHPPPARTRPCAGAGRGGSGNALSGRRPATARAMPLAGFACAVMSRAVRARQAAGQMAAHPLAVDRLPRRRFQIAAPHRERAARREAAAVQRCVGPRHLAGDGRQPAAVAGTRQRGEQHACRDAAARRRTRRARPPPPVRRHTSRPRGRHSPPPRRGRG